MTGVREVGKGQAVVLRSPNEGQKEETWNILSHLRGQSGWLHVLPCTWKVGVRKNVHPYLTYLYFDGSVLNLNLTHVCDLSLIHAVYRKEIGKATDLLPLL